jgi:hypothetical protein
MRVPLASSAQVTRQFVQHLGAFDLRQVSGAREQRASVADLDGLSVVELHREHADRTSQAGAVSADLRAHDGDHRGERTEAEEGDHRVLARFAVQLLTLCPKCQHLLQE